MKGGFPILAAALAFALPAASAAAELAAESSGNAPAVAPLPVAPLPVAPTAPGTDVTVASPTIPEASPTAALPDDLAAVLATDPVDPVFRAASGGANAAGSYVPGVGAATGGTASSGPYPPSAYPGPGVGLPGVVTASRAANGMPVTTFGAYRPERALPYEPEVWHGPPLGAELADLIVIDKSDRRLRLYARGRVMGEYPVALGFAPAGHKLARGDGRTPEGLYRIDRRNAYSSYHLSLGISYPNFADMSRAASTGFDPGGDIFIHGQPNGAPPGSRIGYDWTEGCIALEDDDIREIWSRVANGTPISIQP